MTSLVTSLYRKHETNSVYAPLIKREKVVIPITHNPTLAEMKTMYEQHRVIYRIESGKVISARLEARCFQKYFL